MYRDKQVIVVMPAYNTAQSLRKIWLRASLFWWFCEYVCYFLIVEIFKSKVIHE